MDEVSLEDEEFIKSELGYLADYLRQRYPKLDVRRWILERIHVSV